MNVFRHMETDNADLPDVVEYHIDVKVTWKLLLPLHVAGSFNASLCAWIDWLIEVQHFIRLSLSWWVSRMTRRTNIFSPLHGITKQQAQYVPPCITRSSMLLSLSYQLVTRFGLGFEFHPEQQTASVTYSWSAHQKNPSRADLDCSVFPRDDSKTWLS